MSIYFYSKGEHCAGFKGYRVSVMVDGEHKQTYLPCDPDDNKQVQTMFKQAKKIEGELLLLKNLNASRRKTMFKERKIHNPLHSTGVSGIKIRIPETTGKACFIVQVLHKKKRYNKSFFFEKSYTETWANACKFLTEVKEQPQAYQTVFRRKPDKEKFLLLFALLIKKEVKADVWALPKELRNEKITSLLDEELIPQAKGEFREWLIGTYLDFKKGLKNGITKHRNKKHSRSTEEKISV